MLVCAAVLAGLGIADGAGRKATYTAASTLQVGKVNPNSPGFYGFVQSASDLATVFSRAISAAPVLTTVHKRLRLNVNEVATRLSAAPIPASPAFRVIATGPTAQAAIGLANVAAHALIRYEAGANTYHPETKRLLSEYRAASLRLANATGRVSEAAHQYSLYPHAEQRTRLAHAEAIRGAASLQAQALASSYQLSAQSTTSGLVSLLAGAVTASSDRSSKMQLLGFIGLLGGVVMGCALAVLADVGDGLFRRVTRRSASDSIKR